MTHKEMWNIYTENNPADSNYEAWAFGGNTPEMPDILAKLVLDRIKTATASAFDCYAAENIQLPREGGFNIILDTSGQAVCITKTTRVYIAAFNSVTAEHAYKEGEFDRSLAAWRACHKEIFENELRSIGREFSDDMPVVCEEFEVVYPKFNH